MSNHGKENDEAAEIKRLRDEITTLHKENCQNKIFKEKYIDVIGKLSNLNASRSAASNDDMSREAPGISNTINNSEKLIDNAENILTDVVTSFKLLPPEAQHEVNVISEEGSSFLQRLKVLEQKCAHTESNAKYALSKVHEFEQYLKIDQLLVHDLKDFPRDGKGYIKKGRPVSTWQKKIKRAFLI